MTKATKKLANNLFKINLLIHKGENIKWYYKLLKWVLSSGRYIVIFVEIIVIGAFVFRYKLDTDIADLQDQIQDLIPYIKSYANDEKALRQMQFQLSTIQQTRSQNPDYSQIIMKIAKVTPQTIKLTNINMDKGQAVGQISLSITGQTPSNTDLSAFIKALQADTTFANINLTNIAFEVQTTFTITGNIISKGGSNI